MTTEDFSDWISLIGVRVDVLLLLIILVPAIVAFGLNYTNAVSWSGRRLAFVSALPWSCLGGVVGAWTSVVALMGYGAFFCGNSCAWQNVAAFTHGLFAATALGAVVGTMMGMVAGRLSAFAGEQIASRLSAILNTDGYQ